MVDWLIKSRLGHRIAPENPIVKRMAKNKMARECLMRLRVSPAAGTGSRKQRYPNQPAR
jgi:hypothetical protein